MEIITAIIYQPFFNLLILYYTLLDQIPDFSADMGMAVILLTLSLRILMLPLSIASLRTLKERMDIEKKIKEIHQTSAPTIQKEKVRKVFGSNRRVLISEGLTFLIQMFIFFILYRTFTTGLKGDDIHLIYASMPEYNYPFNLTFLGMFDLTKPNWILNLTQSLVIFFLEIANLKNSPYPVSRAEFIRYVFVLPVAVFFLFMYLPSGKKLFIITTLLFSLVVISTNILTRWFSQQFGDQEEKVVVETEAGVA